MFKDKKVTAIITAAGKGSRMKASLPKQFLTLNGKTILENAVEPFERSPFTDEIIVVTSKEFETLCREKCKRFSKVRKIAVGGRERQDSVNNALKLVTEGCVLIHDGARPYVTEEIINEVLKAAYQRGAAVPCVPVKETVRQAAGKTAAETSAGETSGVETPGVETSGGDMPGEKTYAERVSGEIMALGSKTIDRSSLYTVQTPQGFEAGLIKEAFAKAYEDGFYGTDDASLVDRLGIEVALTAGSYGNIKITTEEDLPMEIRAGSGYDVHRLESGRKLILCGVEVPFEKGLLGHSDADVAVHALMDAMLGAAGLGDIGRLFPDTDMKYKDISSMKLLDAVKEAIEKEGWTLNNADMTIMAQRPKLLPHIEQMRLNIAEALGKDTSCVNVKATTTEKLGFIGREEGIAAEAVCILTRN